MLNQSLEMFKTVLTLFTSIHYIFSFSVLTSQFITPTDAIKIDWGIRMLTNQICVKPGEQVSFVWNDPLPHNTVLLKDRTSFDSCTFDESKSLTSIGVLKEYEWSPPSKGTSSSTYYFACSIGMPLTPVHCFAGQKIAITVSDSCHLVNEDGTNRIQIDTNYGGNVNFGQVYIPSTEKELKRLVSNDSSQPIVAIGSGHSWNEQIWSTSSKEPLYISLRAFNQIQLNVSSMRLRVGAGVIYGDVLPLLEDANLSLPSYSAVNAQTIVGAALTYTHGTGTPSITNFVERIWLMDHQGQVSITHQWPSIWKERSLIILKMELRLEHKQMLSSYTNLVPIKRAFMNWNHHPRSHLLWVPCADPLKMVMTTIRTTTETKASEGHTFEDYQQRGSSFDQYTPVSLSNTQVEYVGKIQSTLDDNPLFKSLSVPIVCPLIVKSLLSVENHTVFSTNALPFGPITPRFIEMELMISPLDIEKSLEVMASSLIHEKYIHTAPIAIRRVEADLRKDLVGSPFFDGMRYSFSFLYLGTDLEETFAPFCKQLVHRLIEEKIDVRYHIGKWFPEMMQE